MGAKRIIYVIYEHPSDYPGKYVTRRWVGMEADPEPLIVADSLQKARNAVPEYTIPIGRGLNDEPAIKEVWI